MRLFSNGFIEYSWEFFKFHDVVPLFFCFFIYTVIYLSIIVFILSCILVLHIVQSVIQPLGCNGFFFLIFIFNIFIIHLLFSVARYVS